MKTFLWIICGSVSLSLAVPASGAENQKPYPHYWMSVATSNQSIPGMTSEVSGIASFFGGKKMFGPQHELLLQLESPRTPTGAAAAEHLVPAGQKMGTSLPLVTPTIEKSKDLPRERRDERPEKFEKPKSRMLIYWGCGEKIGPGQPKVLDTATMSPIEFGKAFAGRTPTLQTPPAPRKGWTYGEWPDRSNRTEIPSDSSLVGSHRVTGNYTPDISFTLDQKRDYMAPVEFSPLLKTPSGGMTIEWKPIATAIGYFATAMGHDQDSEETIFWSASEVPEPGFALQNYLTTGDVARFIKEKVVLDPSKTTCTMPPIFKQGQAGILQFIAYGEELNIVHPPKPKDPKKRWDIDWSAKVRLKSTAMMPLVAGEEGSSPRKAPSARKEEKRAEPKEEQSDATRPDSKESAEESDKPAKEIGNRLRGLFGF